MNELNKHSIILPKGEKVSDLTIQQCHMRCAHGGRGATLNELLDIESPVAIQRLGSSYSNT